MPLPSSSVVPAAIEYPVSDGQPMAETPVHRQNLTDLIAMLEEWYAAEREVYISGNMFIYYVEGNLHRHVAPDVFLVLGVPNRQRDCYKVWEEPKANLDVVIELTSRSTRDEDIDTKYRLYRDQLGVREYFLFDPYQEYLAPPEQGYRLVAGEYQPIAPVAGRLPSEVLGLHLERSGSQLRLYDPVGRRWLPTPREAVQQARAEHQRAEAGRRQAEAERRQAEAERRQAEAERQRAEAERQTAESERAKLAAALEESEAARRQALAELDRLRQRQSPLPGDPAPGASQRNAAGDRE